MNKKTYIDECLDFVFLDFTSCDDFLDTSSKTEMNSETAYSTPAAADMDLVGCYDGWQRTY